MTEELIERYPNKLRISFVGNLPVKAVIEGVEFVPATEAQSLSQRVDELEGVLQKCRDKFREYEGIHALKLRDYKGKEPLDYAANLQFKIERNREMAEMCEASLTKEGAA